MVLGDGVLCEVSDAVGEDFEIPDGVKHIAPSAFGSYIRVKELKVPDSVKNIGDMAFTGCIDMTSIEIPASVEYIGFRVFPFMCDVDDVNPQRIITSAGSYTEWWANAQGCADRLVLK